jgi:catechol 2,3-dioxygenase-like lactoylglutathione lyase family enzyme
MIQHVTREIQASELEPCIAFYRLLGFVPVPVPAGIEGRAVWLEHAGTQIHLMFVGPAAADERRPSGHVGIVVASYPETVERLRAAGHPVQPRREHWGSPRAYVHDPVGNLVELMAWPPPSRSGGPPSEPTGE